MFCLKNYKSQNSVKCLYMQKKVHDETNKLGVIKKMTITNCRPSKNTLNEVRIQTRATPTSKKIEVG